MMAASLPGCRWGGASVSVRPPGGLGTCTGLIAVETIAHAGRAVKAFLERARGPMAGIVCILSLLPYPGAAMLGRMKRSSPARKPAAQTAGRAPMRIAMLAFPDVQVLDVMGPLEVFSRASRWLRDHGHRRDHAYTVEIIGL